LDVIVGTGVDLCEVERIRKAITSPHGRRLLERVFTPREIAYAERKANPYERFAARFAAKEAVMKALGVGLGRFPFRDVEVVRARSGAPGLLLHGKAAALAEERGVVEWRISLTHSELIAAAIVVALGTP
jgi:holo-[acyl-carrier protein] synthase